MEKSTNKECYKGLPQGSSLSPILYAIYVADIINAFPVSHDNQIIQFADDICIFSTNADTKIALRNLQRCGVDLNSSLAEKGLTLAAHKSVLVVFSDNNLSRKRKWKISINNTFIRCQTSVKFLGIIFQSNGKWDLQTQKVVKSCASPTNLISFLTSTWWGAAPQILLILYNALVKSRIEYAAFIYGRKFQNQNGKC